MSKPKVTAKIVRAPKSLDEAIESVSEEEVTAIADAYWQDNLFSEEPDAIVFVRKH